MRNKPDPVDLHVGGRLRDRRTLLGLSQGEIGARLGLSFQQIQKYERDTSRIGASRLYRLSKMLGVPISYFFEDMPMEVVAASKHRAAAIADDAIPTHGKCECWCGPTPVFWPRWCGVISFT